MVIKRLSAFIVFCFSFFGGFVKSQLEVTFVQLNDVYEIAPVQAGRFGGLARVSSIIKEMRRTDPFAYVVLSGDFVSPSIFGFVEWNGKPVRGAQMIDIMNALKVDYVTFGNHEFDISEEDLQNRIDESRFTWISSNVRQVKGKDTTAFHQFNSQLQRKHPLPEYVILNLMDRNANAAKIGILGLTLPYSKKPYVHYLDVNKKAKALYNKIKDSCDVVIALTHLSIEEDKALAKAVPGIKLLMGGHEHENTLLKEGDVIIAKADANAKTIYIHKLKIKGKDCTIESQLKTIDEALPEDTLVARKVKEWMERAYENFRKQGFEPTQIVFQAFEPLNGLETIIRKQPTNLGKLIADCMRMAGDGAQAAILNAGSIRLDDHLQGRVTQYDILRTLPFGGNIQQIDINGGTLLQALEVGKLNTGTGGYLQLSNIELKDGVWFIDGQMLDRQKTYRIMVPEYLMTGKERNLDFLNPANPSISNIILPTSETDIRKDIRQVVIQLAPKILNKN